MERYLKRKVPTEGQSSASAGPSSAEIPQPSSIPRMPTEIDSSDLPWDPFDRIKITQYPHNQRDNVRRKYLTNGPCHPSIENYQPRIFGTRVRRFNPEWYGQYGAWLQYSEKADKAFCLFCYLFKDDSKRGGGDAFCHRRL